MTPSTKVRSADVRAEFASALNQRHDLRTGFDDPEIRQLHEAYVEELRAALKRVAPRARVKHRPEFDTYPSIEASELVLRLEKLKEIERVQEIDARHKPAMHERAEFLSDEVRRLGKHLDALAATAEVRKAGPEGEWHYLDFRSEGDYRSQGYGALRYAEGSVQLVADVARAEGFVDGVDLVVLRVPYAPGEGYLAAVRVQDALDAEILRRSPPLPLREQVRLCWARGVNPRVFSPWLPHGYEEQAGLDHFGRDLRAVH